MVSLNALIMAVEGTWGPLQRSTRSPVWYTESLPSGISSIISSLYLLGEKSLRASAFVISLRMGTIFSETIFAISFSIFSKSEGEMGGRPAKSW